MKYTKKDIKRYVIESGHNEGCVKLYYLDDKGRKHTVVFAEKMALDALNSDYGYHPVK